MENEPQDAYLPVSDSEELQPFDVRAQSNRANMLKLLGGFLFVLALVFVVMKLFASGTRDRDQTPRILADPTPYKEVPLERGGTQTPNQDKEIFDISNKTDAPIAITTSPIAEEPLPKPISKPAANVVIKQPESDIDTNTAEPNKPKTSLAPQPVPLSGDYVVQVASLRSQAQAQQTWSKLSTRMSHILTSSQFADIKRVDLGERGIYYRLRVSGLADKNAAQRLCSRFKANKQDCIVTKK